MEHGQAKLPGRWTRQASKIKGKEKEKEKDAPWWKNMAHDFCSPTIPFKKGLKLIISLRPG